MTRVLLAALPVLMLGIAPVAAAEQVVRLDVDGMTCASCPYIVRQTLAAVPGVLEVEVSYDEASATVRFDDATASVEALTAATARRGYESRPASTPEPEG